MSASDTPRISIVIPTFRDWDALKLTVDAISKQSLPRSQFELILVDNDDAGMQPEWMEDWMQYVHAPEGFSYSARNAGVRASRAPIIAFTDADCIPHVNWLRVGLAAFAADALVQLVAGRIQMVTARRNVFAEYDMAAGIPQEDFVRKGRGAATANLFVRRQVFDQAGMFSETLESGGDLEFCRRAMDHGCKLIYCAEATVSHPARDTFRALYKKGARVSRGRAQRTVTEAGRAWRPLLAGVLRPYKPRPAFWLKMLRGKIHPEAGMGLRVRLVLLRILLQYHGALVQSATILRLLFSRHV